MLCEHLRDAAGVRAASKLTAFLRYTDDCMLLPSPSQLIVMPSSVRIIVHACTVAVYHGFAGPKKLEYTINDQNWSMQDGSEHDIDAFSPV